MSAENLIICHKRKIHHHNPFPTRDFPCENCNKKYTSIKPLRAHAQKFHRNRTVVKRPNKTRIICPYEDC